jgi:hypothetical protein
VFERFDIAAQTWSELPSNDALEYVQCCAGIEYFPGLGLIWVQGGETSAGGGVFRFDESQNQWLRLAKDLPMGNYQQSATYSAAHQVMLFGGGASSALYQLDATGEVTALPDAPIAFGTMSAILTVDPVGGDFLLFGEDGSFRSYDPSDGSWTLEPGSDFFAPVLGSESAIWQVVAAPIDTYGVVMFIKFNFDQSQVYLYKHS